MGSDVPVSSASLADWTQFHRWAPPGKNGSPAAYAAFTGRFEGRRVTSEWAKGLLENITS